MPPSAYRKGGLGMRIRYAVVAPPLGRLLIGTTDRGVCSVALGDGDAELLAALRKEYPRAEVERAADGLSQAASAVVEHLEGTRPVLQLPVDVTATAFQWRGGEAFWRVPPAAPHPRAPHPPRHRQPHSRTPGAPAPASVTGRP